MKFILGKKIGMSQIFDEKGKVVPITLIEAGPCEVLQIKTKEKDGYEAVQIGFGKITKRSRIKKSSAKKPFSWIREFKNNIKDYKSGQKILVSIFREGDKVSISGTTKGKGFQGGVKRWGFSGRGASHGVKHEARTLGSVGSSFPERVVKGRKMPGRTGFERITIKNLKVVKVEEANNILAIRGALPGRRKGLLEIKCIK